MDTSFKTLITMGVVGFGMLWLGQKGKNQTNPIDNYDKEPIYNGYTPKFKKGDRIVHIYNIGSILDIRAVLPWYESLTGRPGAYMLYRPSDGTISYADLWSIDELYEKVSSGGSGTLYKVGDKVQNPITGVTYLIVAIDPNWGTTAPYGCYKLAKPSDPDGARMLVSFVQVDTWNKV